MSFYCDRCYLPFDGDKCPVCGRKSTRTIDPDDICFLTEKAPVWSDMLADVLHQEKIPFTQKNVMGAGLALSAGPMFESIRFYVLYKHLAQAKEIVDTLFSSPIGETDSEETE